MSPDEIAFELSEALADVVREVQQALQEGLLERCSVHRAGYRMTDSGKSLLKIAMEPVA